MVGVLGITQSSQAELLDQIQRLGTNLLTVQNGRSFGGGEAELPLTTAATVGVVPGVQRVTATQQLVDVNVYRSDLVPAFRTGGLGVRACDTALLETLGGRLLRGVWFGPVTARHPTTVLGYGVALALPAREVGGQVMQAVGHADTLEGGLGEAASQVPGEAAVEEAVGHVVPSREPLQQVEVLKDEAQLPSPQPGQRAVRQASGPLTGPATPLLRSAFPACPSRAAGSSCPSPRDRPPPPARRPRCGGPRGAESPQEDCPDIAC